MKSPFWVAILGICGWLLTFSTVHAQESYDVQKGLTPYGSYKGGDLDSVNMVNGNLALHIPLISFPQRGKSLRMNYSIYSNDKQYMFDYSITGSEVTGGWWLFGGPCPSGGYIGCDSGALLAHVGAYIGTDQGNGGVQDLLTTAIGDCVLHPPLSPCLNPVNNLYVLGPDDSRHYFGSYAADSGGTYYNCGPTVDLSGFVVGPIGANTTGCTGQITDHDGIVGGTDVDGNYYGSGGDTLGRVFTTTSASVSNCAAGTTSAQAWNVPGSSKPYYLCYTNLSYQTAFNALNYSHCYGLNGAGETNGTQSMLTQVVLPNSTYFQFSYDQYLSVTQVTLPTGGSISYTWQNVDINSCNMSAPVSRALASRTKNDGISSVTWHYQWIPEASGSPWQHVITDPMGNDEVHKVTPSTGTDDEVDYYSGCSPINNQYCSAGTGSALKTVQNAYQTTGDAGIMGAGQLIIPDVPIPKTKTTILAGGKTSKIVYTPSPAAYSRGYTIFNADSSQPPETGNSASFYSGQIMSVAEYDYGPGTPGSLLRTTTTTYKWQDPSNGSAYIAANLFSLPWKVVVTDGNGYQCSETDYTYDEPAYLTTYSGTTVQHGVPPTGSVRGNATTISQWLSSTPCQSGATGTSTTTHHNYMYDTGEKYEDIDALGNTTQYTYSSTYYGGYRTQTQLPDTAGGTVHHIVSGTYDLNTGLLKTFVGQNGAMAETTTYNWDLNMRRIVQAIFPNTGQTQFCYTDSGTVSPGSTCSQTAPPYQVQMQELQKTSTWITKTVTFDELGRSKEAQLTSDPSGTDYTDTTYDGDGRVATVSNPHRTTASTTDGTTQTQYDGLGRAIFVTKQDGSMSQTEYLDSCNVNTNTLATTVTDEAGKVRRSCTDALGRLTEVDEPGTGAADATPATGTITVGGTEQSNTYNGCPNNGNCPVTIYNSGSVSVSFGGEFTAITGYGQGSTAAMVATGLTAQLNVASSPVTATVSGSTITLTAKLPGASTDYTFSTAATYSNALCPTSPCFSAPSFTASPASGALTGGTDPNLGSAPLVALYFYDGLGNLLCVEQHGGVTGTGCSSNSSNDHNSPWRVRRFTYDSFSRLLMATNPETGFATPVTYTYDNNGNVLTKVDPRGITINYSPTGSPIDQLGRVTKKTYSNGDTSVTYSYDASGGCSPSTGNCGIGHRTGMTDASGSTTWTFDNMGRTLSETNVIAGFSKTISTAYNKDGSISQITYPTDSGSILAYTYDAAGHLTTLKDTAHTITYLKSAVYFPPGELNQATFGTVKETSIFNDRMQPCWFYATTGTALSASTLCTGTASAANVLDMKYNFGLGTGDNGDLLSFTNDKDSNRSVTYGYDALNRITSAVTPNTDCSLVTGTLLTKNWGESFTIDAWGNLTGKTVTKCSAESLSVGPATLQNQLPSSAGFGYDAAGDMTSNGSATYTYNGEGQLKTTAGVTYTYDGDGNRVEKSNGTLYWGTGMLESDGSGNLQREFIFAGGKRIARRDLSGGAVYYYFTDDLGSSSVVTNSTGVIQNESDYYPYGGERVYTLLLSNQNYKFTGKERDAESGLDNFGARYDSSALGRFMTPDWAARPTTVPYAVFGDPQSLNLYGYVRNDPVSSADADGHFGVGDYSSPVTGIQLFNEGSQVNGNVERDEGQASDEHWLAQGEVIAQLNRNEAAAQNTPLSSVAVLGNTVGITYGAKLSAADQLTASNAIAAAAGLINKNASSLTADETKAIGQISSFSVVGPKTDLGATGKGSMTLSIGYIGASSSAWIGSLFGHEGQHYLNSGKYSGANLWRDEQSAGRTQLGIGNKIGFSSSERQHLEQWIDDRNRAAMQQHMEQGYSY